MTLEFVLSALLAAGAAGSPTVHPVDPAHRRTAQRGPAGSPAHAAPALTVVISIDQFPARYLSRFAPLFGEDGFAEFQRGAVFEASRYPYAATLTGPGHAAIGTGLPPSRSGIVGNAWYERGAGGELRKVYCVDDPRTEVVTAAGGKVVPLSMPGGRFSPVNLSGDSLGDRLVERYPDARVIGVALKDRAAILMAGRRAQAAYWYSEEAHRFVSSRYYPGLDAALLAYRTECVDWGATSARCPWKVWTPRRSLGGGLEAAGVLDTPETEAFEKVPDGLERTGQDEYRIAEANGLLFTPYGNTLVLDFTRRIVELERLGRRGVPDLLFVGLSSMDYVGHQFGPDSAEVADTVRSLDRDLAAFVRYVRSAVGAARVTFVRTSDHGVQPIPDVARVRAERERRVADVGEVSSRRLEALAADAAKGAVSAPSVERGPHRIAAFEAPGIWLDWSALSQAAGGLIDAERVRRAVRDALAPGKVAGVSGAWTSGELLAPCERGTEGEAAERLRLCEAVRRSFRADRSADVIVTLRPGWIWKSGHSAATHGQPVADDMDVPLVFWGAGVVRGLRSKVEASPLDIAPTLGALLGVEAGRPGARPLPCLAEPVGGAAAGSGG
jgi:predicted AlkP superfamily pyrophosphatase or phosphodiesterase